MIIFFHHKREGSTKNSKSLQASQVIFIHVDDVPYAERQFTVIILNFVAS